MSNINQLKLILWKNKKILLKSHLKLFLFFLENIFLVLSSCYLGIFFLIILKHNLKLQINVYL